MAMELVPYLCVGNGAAAIDFYKKAFDATETMRMPFKNTDKLLHAELSVGGSKLYLADDFPDFNGGKPRTPEAFGGTPAGMHLAVPDCDATVERAVGAGATVCMPPGDMFWGSRFAKIKDPFGHEWSLSSPLPPDRAAAAAESAKEWM